MFAGAARTFLTYSSGAVLPQAPVVIQLSAHENFTRVSVDAQIKGSPTAALFVASHSALIELHMSAEERPIF